MKQMFTCTVFSFLFFSIEFIGRLENRSRVGESVNRMFAVNEHTSELFVEYSRDQE